MFVRLAPLEMVDILIKIVNKVGLGVADGRLSRLHVYLFDYFFEIIILSVSHLTLVTPGSAYLTNGKLFKGV